MGEAAVDGMAEVIDLLAASVGIAWVGKGWEAAIEDAAIERLEGCLEVDKLTHLL